MLTLIKSRLLSGKKYKTKIKYQKEAFMKTFLNFALYLALIFTSLELHTGELKAENLIISGNNVSFRYDALKSEFHWNSRGFGSVFWAQGTTIGPCKFFLNTPEVVINLANQTSMPNLLLGSWTPYGWYAGSNTHELYKIDTTTGARTFIGAMPVQEFSTGLAWDTTTNTLFVVSSNINTSISRLYSVDPTNASVTFIGQTNNAFLCCLACDNSGTLYSIDRDLDNFGTVNKSTGEFTVIGPVGFNISIGDMECDRSTDSLFLAADDSVLNAGQLRRINKTTGATTLINWFQGGSSVNGFAIPSNLTVSVKKISGELPVCYSLEQNYPNPFNPLTKINFSLPKSEYVTLTIYNMLGMEIIKLVNNKLHPGIYTVYFDGSGFSGGVYFYHIKTDSFVNTKKMVLIK